MSRTDQIKRLLALSVKFEDELVFDEVFDELTIVSYALHAQRIAPRHNGYWETTFRRDARRIQERRTR